MAYTDNSPAAAEMYFNRSIFGQLYTSIADLGRAEPRRAAGRATARHSSPADRASARHSSPTDRASARHSSSADRATAPQTLLERLDAWFWRKAQADREAYLARSNDVFDLERRIEALERGTITRYY